MSEPGTVAYEAARAERAERKADALRSVLLATHKLITEGALVGFIPTEGTWAERLFKNQGVIHDTLNPKWRPDDDRRGNG